MQPVSTIRNDEKSRGGLMFCFPDRSKPLFGMVGLLAGLPGGVQLSSVDLEPDRACGRSVEKNRGCPGLFIQAQIDAV